MLCAKNVGHARKLPMPSVSGVGNNVIAAVARSVPASSTPQLNRTPMISAVKRKPSRPYLETGERIFCSSETMNLRLQESWQRLLAAAGDIDLDESQWRFSDDETEVEETSLAETLATIVVLSTSAATTATLVVDQHRT